MSLTMTAKPLANAVAGTDYIVAIIDGPVTSKLFSVVTYTVASTLPALGAGANYTANAPYTANSANPKLPQLTTLTAVSASDGTDTDLGMLVATLTPDSADVVNASSPMTYRFSGNALAITATSSS